MDREEIAETVISHLAQKHNCEVNEDTYLDDIGEDCHFSLTFELAALFGRDEYCDGDEIGEHATVGHAIDAMENLM